MIYKVIWHVPVVQEGLKSYQTKEQAIVFKHKRTAVRFKNQLLSCYEFIGIDLKESYVKLVEEQVY